MLERLIGTLGLALVAAGGAQAATIPLTPTAFGFYHEGGSVVSTTNHAVGFFAGSPPGELRNFFVFDLSGVNVSTDLTTLAAGTGGTAAFTDLGTGTSFGSVVVSAASNGQNVDVALNLNGLLLPASTRRTRRCPSGSSTTLRATSRAS